MAYCGIENNNLPGQQDMKPVRREHKVNTNLKFFNPETSYSFNYPKYDKLDRFLIKNLYSVTTNDKMPFINRTTY